MKIIFSQVLLICALLSAFPFRVFPQNQANPNFRPLEETISAELREKNGVGAAVAVIKNDKVIYAKGFGTSNVETGAPVTPRTLFQIGSVTKTFTAAMILSMAEAGEINADAPVGNYAKNLNRNLSRVTLRQLLSHTAGIIDEPDEYGAQDESLMATYIRSWDDGYSLFDAGKVFSYSNSGFALAGFAAQEASGKLYADLMNERIFAPLAMKSTTFRPTVAMTYPLAVGHAAKNGEKPSVVRPMPHDARLYPAGTMYSSLQDLSGFAIAFLNGGKLGGKQILSPAVIEQMSLPRAEQLSSAEKISYGCGLFISNAGGIKKLWHDGSMTGYTASMLFVPERRLAVIVLGNANNVVFDKTQAAALELTGVKQKPGERQQHSVMPLSEGEMIKYVGVYRQPKRFEMEIFMRAGKLFIKEFNQEMPLAKIGENRFSFRFPQAKQSLEIYVQPASGDNPGFVHQYVWAFRKIR